MKHLIILLSILIGSVTQAKTLTGSKDKLERLSKSLRQMYKKSCTVENLNAQYRLDLAKCIPPNINLLLDKKRASMGGPNCWNFSLYSLGIASGLRHFTGKSMGDFYFNEDSPVCKLIDYKDIQPGDIVSDGSGEMSNHAFVFINTDYILEKWGPSIGNDWTIVPLSQNNEDLRSGLLNETPLENPLFVYRCKKLDKTNVPSKVRASLKKLTDFQKKYSQFYLKEKLAWDSLYYLKSTIDDLKESLSITEIQHLVAASTNPSVYMEVMGIFESYYSIAKTAHYTKYNSGEIDEEKNAFAQVFIKNYLIILNEFALSPGFNISISSFIRKDAKKYCSTDRTELTAFCGQ